MNNKEKTGELLLCIFYNIFSIDYGYALEHRFFCLFVFFTILEKLNFFLFHVFRLGLFIIIFIMFTTVFIYKHKDHT